MSDSLATFQDNTCGFMSDNTIALEDQLSNATGLPKVKIGTFGQLLVKAGTRELIRRYPYPQIPVALI